MTDLAALQKRIDPLFPGLMGVQLSTRPRPSAWSRACRFGRTCAPAAASCTGVRTWLSPTRSAKIVLAAMPALQLQIVEFAREHGRVTIGETIRLTGASRNTLKQHFRALVERGTLNQHGSGRGGWCGLR